MGLEERLTLEPGCLQSRNWRYRVPPEVPAGSLVAALVRLGWVDESRFEVLREVRHPEGHRILVVPETGRLQIRLDLGVAEQDRRGVALRIAADVQAALTALGVAA